MVNFNVKETPIPLKTCACALDAKKASRKRLAFFNSSTNALYAGSDSGSPGRWSSGKSEAILAPGFSLFTSLAVSERSVPAM